MSPEKLIRMANQIATFFESQPEAAPAAIAAHINDFWEPRMRAQLLAIGAAGDSAPHATEEPAGAGAPQPTAMRPAVRAALPLLRQAQPA